MENESKQNGPHHEEATIHIDKKTYKSPNPTTGAALYQLGSVDATQYDLFLEVHGPGDDEPISNDNTQIQLENGSHFYTAQKNLNPGAFENGRGK